MFTNNISHNRFIGESSNLLQTFLNFNSKSFPDKNPKSRIQRAIRKHSYANFSIAILEYCNASELRSQKQYYINVLKPQYNIRKSICKPLVDGASSTTVTKMSMKNNKKSKA